MVQDRRFHLGWFLSFNTPYWNDVYSGNNGAEWMDGSFHIDMLQSLERAGFDLMMLEDSTKVPNTYQGSTKWDLAYGNFAPKHDPIPLLGILAAATKHIGVVGTMSTSFYPPYILARLMSTLDHLTHGRVGWNMVTSSGDLAAKNYGMDKLIEHDLRYEMADEYVRLVRELWHSWEPDALLMDRETGQYVDPDKVHTIDFEGRWFKSRGPLTTLPSPQGMPVFGQAGGSNAGRDFAAKYSEFILCASQGVEAMKEYRDDIRARMKFFGRDPDTCKVLFITEPIIGRTAEEAQVKKKVRYTLDEYQLHCSLSWLSAHTEIDFSTLDLDAPLPELSTNAHQTSLKSLYHMGDTVREIAETWWHHYINEDFVGTPEQVADAMEAAMDEIGGDGFLIETTVLTRSYIADITDALVPELQRRGLTRTSYTHELFRDNLMEF
ncbi:NtaA/DmoA family FMN-dependent monooxygenase [Herbiconiux moechotypicola]|uniref:NtaA/DmoA family FMN-dependent monooxygenase n=1 Tax=Herbiconiux moechotypicola TaxID=637393 RepID=A0ABN3DEE0_9MICO|nr:NtaA/DmoA family FMN-dependent monooxygenase [Herbiconiux moechotypicola]MCS5729143.1 NtaA/DmoA family FMN-dependent monooxygenase [Herbiconiux moechotypicola]